MAPTLYPFQEEGVAAISRFGGRALLADQMGLGKTLSSLTWAVRNPKLSLPCVVICPAGLKWQWDSEAARHYGISCNVLEGIKKRSRVSKSRKGVYVVNYDILHAWLPWLMDLQPGLMIADESHFCANQRSKRTKALRKLARITPHMIAMSGTPLVNRPSELYPILNMLRPDIWNSFYEFASMYCKLRDTPWGPDFSGARNLPLLHSQLLQHVMIRRLKSEVLKDLPEKTRSVVTLPNAEAKEYERARTDFLGWLGDVKPEYLRSAARAEAISQLSYLKHIAARGKMDGVFDWIDSFLEEDDGKLILFTWHRSILDRLVEKYEDICVAVDGRTPKKLRKAHYRKFLGNKDMRLFFGNLKATGTGWSAPGVNNVAFVEMGWAPGDHNQAEDRAHGLFRGVEGQNTNVYYLIARGTVEERLASILQTKSGTLSSVLDGGEQEDDIQVFDQLMRSMRGDRE